MEWLTPKLSRSQYREAYMASLQRQITNNDMNWTANQVFNSDGTASDMDTSGMSKRALIDILSVKFQKFTRNPSATLTMLSDTQIRTLAQISDAVVNEFNAKGPNTNYRGEPLDSQLFLKDLMEMMGANNLGNLAMKQRDTMLRTPQITPQASKNDVGTSTEVNEFVDTGNENEAALKVNQDNKDGEDLRGKLQDPVINQETVINQDPAMNNDIFSRLSNIASHFKGLSPNKSEEVAKEEADDTEAREKISGETDKVYFDYIRGESAGSVYAQIEKHLNDEHKSKYTSKKGSFKGLDWIRDHVDNQYVHTKYNEGVHKIINKTIREINGKGIGGNMLDDVRNEMRNRIAMRTQQRAARVENPPSRAQRAMEGARKAANAASTAKRLARMSNQSKTRGGRVMYGTGLAAFGHYNIDLHDLDKNNKVTLRYKNNRKVHTVPSNLVGGNMIACLKSVVEGKNPSYKNVSSLTDAEKDYLNELGNKADIEELAQIRSGTKDEEERDFHQFKILTGEISAGNDSKQLVADYKKLMLKLMSKGRIDRNKGKSILMDLAVIGY